MTPEQRALRSRLGGLTTAARGHVNTGPARRAFLDRFYEGIPDDLPSSERDRRARRCSPASFRTTGAPQLAGTNEGRSGECDSRSGRVGGAECARRSNRLTIPQSVHTAARSVMTVRVVPAVRSAGLRTVGPPTATTPPSKSWRAAPACAMARRSGASVGSRGMNSSPPRSHSAVDRARARVLVPDLIGKARDLAECRPMVPGDSRAPFASEAFNRPRSPYRRS
jgi:hypothetical protein